MTPIFLTLIAAATGYFLGSIPFGLIITRLTTGGDIRDIGSGNIGATNVLRTGRKDIALITLLLDAAKAGVAALIILAFLGGPYHLIAAVFGLIGHCFPIWLGFKGGKGVATFFGGVFAVYWPLGLICAAVWLMTAFATRYSSLSALLAAFLAPFVAYAIGAPQIAAMTSAMAIIIVIRHRDNIARLRAGTESKIGKKGG